MLSKLSLVQVYLALKYGLKPIGTIAHEWIMAVGATYGYKGVNGKAMDLWEEGKHFLHMSEGESELTPSLSSRPDFAPLDNAHRHIHRQNIL